MVNCNRFLTDVQVKCFSSALGEKFVFILKLITLAMLKEMQFCTLCF